MCEISYCLGNANHPHCLYQRSFYTYGAFTKFFELYMALKLSEYFHYTRALKPRVGDAKGWSMSGF